MLCENSFYNQIELGLQIVCVTLQSIPSLYKYATIKFDLCSLDYLSYSRNTNEKTSERQYITRTSLFAIISSKAL